MDIVRNSDGTLVVPVPAPREHEKDSDDADVSTGGGGGSGDAPAVDTERTTRLLHPGEGGYDEALAEWDVEQNPDRAPGVSTADGRQAAMQVVHAIATSPDHAVGPALGAVEDPEATGEALRYVLVGGVHSVEDFAAAIAAAEGGDPLPAHETAKIIGEVLAELD